MWKKIFLKKKKHIFYLKFNLKNMHLSAVVLIDNNFSFYHITGR